VRDTTRDTKKEKVDFLGLSFLILWLFSMQIVLDKGQQYGWFDCTWICWLSIFALGCMFFFIIWEFENDTPIVNLRVFKDINFFVGTILGTMVNVMVCVTIILLPQFYQGLMHYTASLTGLALSSRVVACVVLLVIAKICKLIDPRIVIAIGFLLLGSSILLCADLNLQVAPTTIILSNVLFGIAAVFTLVPISALALGTLPSNQIANAAGIHSLTKCVCGSVFTSLASSFAIRLSQVHQTYLLKNMTIYNQVFVKHFSVMKHAFMHSAPPIVAGYKAQALMYKQLIVQAKLCALADLFQFAALVTFLMIPLVLFLRMKRSEKKVS
jgi:DHA2 family multidrug resistance protein